jgi:hypothetical protein
MTKPSEKTRTAHQSIFYGSAKSNNTRFTEYMQKASMDNFKDVYPDGKPTRFMPTEPYAPPVWESVRPGADDALRVETIGIEAQKTRGMR